MFKTAQKVKALEGRSISTLSTRELSLLIRKSTDPDVLNGVLNKKAKFPATNSSAKRSIAKMARQILRNPNTGEGGVDRSLEIVITYGKVTTEAIWDVLVNPHSGASTLEYLYSNYHSMFTISQSIRLVDHENVSMETLREIAARIGDTSSLLALYQSDQAIPNEECRALLRKSIPLDIQAPPPSPIQFS